MKNSHFVFKFNSLILSILCISSLSAGLRAQSALNAANHTLDDDQETFMSVNCEPDHSFFKQISDLLDSEIVTEEKTGKIMRDTQVLDNWTVSFDLPPKAGRDFDSIRYQGTPDRAQPSIFVKSKKDKDWRALQIPNDRMIARSYINQALISANMLPTVKLGYPISLAQPGAYGVSSTTATGEIRFSKKMSKTREADGTILASSKPSKIRIQNPEMVTKGEAKTFDLDHSLGRLIETQLNERFRDKMPTETKYILIGKSDGKDAEAGSIDTKDKDVKNRLGAAQLLNQNLATDPLAFVTNFDAAPAVPVAKLPAAPATQPAKVLATTRPSTTQPVAATTQPTSAGKMYSMTK